MPCIIDRLMSSFQLTPRSARAARMREVWSSSAVAALKPQEVVLVTDFDGTLAEIVSDPARASILPASLAALRRLSTLLRRVVVLSSRHSADLEHLVPLKDIDLIGDSGLSRISTDERSRLDRFNVEAARLLSGTAGVWLEIKPGATAVHYRQSPASAEEVLSVIRPAIDETGLHAVPGRRVIEVMTHDRPKGVALEAVAHRLRPVGIVCIGDDENDRPMFEFVGTLNSPHLAVGAASAEAPPDLFASCDLVLEGPDEVSSFLSMLAEWAQSA